MNRKDRVRYVKEAAQALGSQLGLEKRQIRELQRGMSAALDGIFTPVVPRSPYLHDDPVDCAGRPAHLLSE